LDARGLGVAEHSIECEWVLYSPNRDYESAGRSGGAWTVLRCEAEASGSD